MKSSRLQVAVVLALACAAGVETGSVRAADVSSPALEEIVVTAQKREQNLQDVPISIAAFSQDTLRERGVTSTAALGTIAPGVVTLDYGNPVITVFTVRGVSQFDFGDHQEAPIATFVDGSYVPYLSGVGMNLFDLQRVEVQRGPQGTLFGRNATGGVISLVSAPPTDTLDGFADLSAGNYGALRLEAAIGGPLTDSLRGRLSVVKDSHDGYFDNAIGPDKGDADNTSWRAQLAGDIGERGSFGIVLRGTHDNTSTSPYQPQAAYPDPVSGEILSGNGQAHADFCAAYFGTEVSLNAVDCLSGDVANSDPFKIRHNRGGAFDRDYYGGTVTVNWDFAAAKFTSITSYGKLKKKYVNEDSDGTSLDVLYFGQSVDAHDFSQELRLAGDSERLAWVAGAYFLDIDGDYGTEVGFFPFDPTFDAVAVNAYTQQTRSWAVFGQADLKLTSRLTLTAGGRWTDDRKHFNLDTQCTGAACDAFGLTDPSIVQGSGFNDSVPGAKTTRSSGNWDAKLQLGFKPADNMLLYAGVTRGTKAGGYNGGATAFYTVDQTIFDDEELTSYEAGVKSLFSGGRVSLNASAFYYDYAHIQVFSQSGPSTVTFNRDGRAYGGELELAARVAEGLDLGLGVSLLDTHIDPIDVQNILTGEITRKSQEMVNAPGATVNAVARKEWAAGSGAVSVQADAAWTDKKKLNLIDNPATREPSYTVANLRVGYSGPGDRWEVSLYGLNITDEHYRTVATPFVTFTGSVIEIYGPPRTYGASLRVRVR
jgi:iron complex outermembrane receptor protein